VKPVALPYNAEFMDTLVFVSSLLYPFTSVVMATESVSQPMDKCKNMQQTRHTPDVTQLGRSQLVSIQLLCLSNRDFPSERTAKPLQKLVTTTTATARFTQSFDNLQ
jgi:hypothetical protein